MTQQSFSMADKRRQVIPTATRRSFDTVIQRIEEAGLSIELIGDGHYRVTGASGTFEFWPQTLFWKQPVTERQGYTTAKLIEAAKGEA